MKLGQVVHVRAFVKGEDRAHVVVAEPREGRVKLAYCATERFYVAKWYAVEFVITDLKDNHHVRRARRWLAKAEVGPGGWKRILCGPWAGGEWETVGHVDIEPAFKYDRFEDCPDARKHTKQPAGYVDRALWAEHKAKTHDCHRCPTCGFWSIWRRKPPRPAPDTIKDAIAILADAAKTDGMVLVAALRLGLYPTKASALALAAFNSDRIQDGVTRQPAACKAAEALMRTGWTP